MAGESEGKVLAEETCSLHRALLGQGWQKHPKSKALKETWKERRVWRTNITVNIHILFVFLFVVSSNRDYATYLLIWLGNDPKRSMANL